MLHSIPNEGHGPLTSAMSDAVQACVHCGFCLAACPTYPQEGREADTPRGRIVLMKQVLEGGLPWADARPHVDRCLGCLACEPACPSGVPYRNLISPFRAVADAHFHRSPTEKLRRRLAAWALPHPNRMRWAVRAAGIGKLLRPLTPPSLRPMLDLAPSTLPPSKTFPETNPAVGARRARAALLAGCAQQVLEPDINAATIEVLTRQGVEVVVPAAQGCCGGLAWHTGDLPAAQACARRNLDAFPDDVDAILTNAAGCGSAMHEYPLILRGTDAGERAEKFSRRVVDVSVFLDRIGWVTPPRGFGKPVRIAYQDACHLANAQGVRRQPRRLLAAIPGVEVVELADGAVCCGSAGTYNMDQPKIAEALGRAKASAVVAANVDVVATGNIGCLTQMQRHMDVAQWRGEIRHTFQILRDALG
jgi:glycolate oxidase iron-sulfur subunit